MCRTYLLHNAFNVRCILVNQMCKHFENISINVYNKISHITTPCMAKLSSMRMTMEYHFVFVLRICDRDSQHIDDKNETFSSTEQPLLTTN